MTAWKLQTAGAALLSPQQEQKLNQMVRKPLAGQKHGQQVQRPLAKVKLAESVWDTKLALDVSPAPAKHSSKQAG